MYRIISGVCAFLLFVCLWSGSILLFDIPSFILPSPFQVFHVFSTKYVYLLTQASLTFQTVIMGLLMATALGFLTSLLFHYFPKFGVVLTPLMLFSQAVPIFALAPLIILFCGFGLSSQLTLMSLVLYFTITSNLTAGLNQTPRAYLDHAKLYGFSSTQLFFYLKLPAAMPHFSTGLKVATAFAPVAALLSEWVGAAEGLGALILSSYTRVQIELMFAALLTLFLFSLILHMAVSTLMKRYLYVV